MSLAFDGFDQKAHRRAQLEQFSTIADSARCALRGAPAAGNVALGGARIDGGLRRL